MTDYETIKQWIIEDINAAGTTKDIMFGAGLVFGMQRVADHLLKSNIFADKDVSVVLAALDERIAHERQSKGGVL